MEGKIWFFLFGLVMAGVGFSIWWRMQACTKKVTGFVKSVDITVIYRKHGARDGYRSTFAYSVDGIEYVKQSNIKTITPRFSEGESVTIFYNPSNPKQFYIPEERKSPVSVLVGFGVIFMLMAPFMDIIMK